MFRTLLWLSLVALVFGAPGTNWRKWLDGRIVGGEDVEIEDYPYQVALLYYGILSCGGSILNERTILTAAHCTYGRSPSVLSIRTGSSFENRGGTVIKVKEIIDHPLYDRGTKENDVSVLKLEEDIEMGPGSQPVTLPADFTSPKAGSDVVCTGWGSLFSEGWYPSQLQGVELQIIDHKKCEADYDGFRKITSSMLCAGINGGGKDSCQGDSGGPLVDKNGVQVGVVSWGRGCGDSRYPGVYADVGHLLGFIRDAAGPLNDTIY